MFYDFFCCSGQAGQLPSSSDYTHCCVLSYPTSFSNRFICHAARRRISAQETGSIAYYEITLQFSNTNLFSNHLIPFKNAFVTFSSSISYR
ncbi:MAG: hypothetical protein HXN34_08725 [Prevotella histicola]|nr:hypothetical protein [Prevotella histicola]